MRRPTRGAGGAGQNDSRRIRVRAVQLAGRLAVAKQLAERLRRIPPREPGGRACSRAPPPARALEHSSKRQLELAQRVTVRLDAREQAVEGRDVAARGVDSERIRLDEGRPGAYERVVDSIAAREVAAQEGLDELRDELAEVGMEAMDVLRALGLR